MKKRSTLSVSTTNTYVGGLFQKHTQELPDDLTGLKEQRNASKDQREGEFIRVASIPTIVVRSGCVKASTS